ncbi:alpha/beta fold hydrolase [Rothia sp. AR01]|uniref:Alpha/beta fold hydrolase n=1 Tax=Rothia santali TaxID=2949643 RepID=A0A9X2HFB5_9MICC|nr:alpha/beta fold hydrolase [Rothia santali]MCP3425732.1 alpha/beta fold hydrolase [Rothia santali]
MSEQTMTRPWLSGLRTGLLAGAGIAGVGVGVVASLAGYYARFVVTPPKIGGNEDLPVLGVGFDTAAPEEGQEPTTITLPANPHTLDPGRYLLTFDADRGSAELGELLSYSPRLRTVTRSVERVHSGDLSAAVRGRWSGAVFLDPRHAGYRYEEVPLELPVGRAPAWVVPAPAGSDCGTWAVMVHGRGASRRETLRALGSTQRLGMASIHPSYRNDREAPPSEDGRYGLGFTEWEDVDVAIEYALAHGARDVVLFGWSMGGAIALQAADKSRFADRIRALVLDGPVVDWFELIRYHTESMRLPLRMGQLVAEILAAPRTKLMTGLDSPILLTDLDWLTRSAELTTPTLIIHSVHDDYVPAEASAELAARNPLVHYVPFHQGQHTKEWNVDPARWDRTVTEWLPQHLGRTGDDDAA